VIYQVARAQSAHARPSLLSAENKSGAGRWQFTFSFGRSNIDRAMSFRAVIESIPTSGNSLLEAMSSLLKVMCLNHDISTKLNVGSHSRA